MEAVDVLGDEREGAAQILLKALQPGQGQVPRVWFAGGAVGAAFVVPARDQGRVCLLYTSDAADEMSEV